MSQKHTYTTSDYMEWSTMLNLVRRLYRDGYFRISLLIGCGCFFGLRISDLLSLTWEMLLEGDSFMIQEKKTGKRRIIRINPNFRLHIEDCFNALDVRDKSEKCFLKWWKKAAINVTSLEKNSTAWTTAILMATEFVILMNNA